MGLVLACSVGHRVAVGRRPVQVSKWLHDVHQNKKGGCSVVPVLQVCVTYDIPAFGFFALVTAIMGCPSIPDFSNNYVIRHNGRIVTPLGRLREQGVPHACFMSVERM